jgi:hypothetical protein
MNQGHPSGQLAPQALPNITALSPGGGPSSGGNPVTITGSGLAGATGVRFGSNPATFTAVSDNQISAIAPAGSGTVLVSVTTISGTSNSLPYTYAAIPALTALNPGSGPASGGNGVVLTGTNLANATSVHFGAALAVFMPVSGTQVGATAPAGSGTVQVTVTTGSGTSNSLPYTYVPAPTIISISPSQGPLAGGNSVTLTGTGFTAGAVVTFGGTPASSVTVADSGHLTAVAPGGNPLGAVPVTVITAAGTSNAVSYFYLAQPTVTAVAPERGPAAGGTGVTLTGTGFTGASAVRFGATAATSFTVVSDNQITAVAPAGSGTAQITVTTPGGVSGAGSASAYAYLAAPVLTSLAPSQGPTSGGNAVTITGTALTFTSAVRFGGTPAAFAVVSDTQVVALAPPGSAGGVPVTLSTPGGTSTGLTYTYVAPPGT